MFDTVNNQTREQYQIELIEAANAKLSVEKEKWKAEVAATKKAKEEATVPANNTYNLLTLGTLICTYEHF